MVETSYICTVQQHSLHTVVCSHLYFRQGTNEIRFCVCYLFLVLICFVTHVSRTPYQHVVGVSQDVQQQNTPLTPAGPYSVMLTG